MSDVRAIVAGTAITLAAYCCSVAVRRRYVTVATTPILVTVGLIALAIALGRMPYDTYRACVPFVSSWLGPACAALGVIMYKQRALLVREALPVFGGLAAGTIATVVSALTLATLLHVPRWLAESLALKSVTAPVAVQLAARADVDPAIVAAIVVSAGTIGAVAGPWLLRRAGVVDPLSRGLALGAISHGIGTAQAATEGETTAAGASLAMCVVAIVMAFAASPILLFAANLVR